MKTRALSTFALGALITALGCGPQGHPGTASSRSSSAVDEFGTAWAAECNYWQSTLIAGQSIDAGTVVVTNTAHELLVEITTSEPWLLAEVHIYAGLDPVPLNDGGNPAPGQFPYSMVFEPPYYPQAQYAIRLADIGAGCGDTINVAVHAAVVQVGEGGGLTDGETAWADGPTPFPGSRWGWSFPYAICCVEPPEEDEGCTLTQGYWKNHSRYADNPSQQQPWPIDEDTALCGSTWYEVINDSAVRGNAWLQLAHQWIAANLNVASGAAVPDEVGDALVEADTLLQGYCTELPEEEAERARELADLLDTYNNGEIGPGHCE